MIRRQKKKSETVEGIEGGEYVDIHNKLMAAYPEGKTQNLQNLNILDLMIHSI